MVARRLADEAVQPAEFAFNNDNAAWAEKRIALYPPGRQQSAVIPLLMRAQDQEGWVSRAVIERVAEMLDMPYIRVLEVATFYTQFQLQPVGSRAHVQVCGTTPCMLRGAEDLLAVCQRKIHPEPHHTNADGTLSWEEVECAGACVNAPMVTIYHDTYEDLTPERLEEIIDAFAEGRGSEIKPGPQIDRLTSAPEGGRVTLLEEPTAKREAFVPPPPPDDPAASPAPRPAAPAAPQAPVTAGRPRDVSEESAPAIKGPSPDAKVSQAKAEGERRQAAREAGGTTETPRQAMREGAVGAEAEGGKLGDGKAPGKPDRGGAPAAAQSAGTAQSKPAIEVPEANPDEVNPIVEKGGRIGPIFEVPKGEADDLQLISGVGPVLERRLNALGVTRYDQIARMEPAELAQLDAAMGFRGRIMRDEWQRQAEALARGGIEEYRRVFGKDPK